MIFGRRNDELKRVKYEAEVDLAQYLINWGFTSEEAMKAARKFWDKHKDILRRIL